MYDNNSYNIKRNIIVTLYFYYSVTEHHALKAEDMIDVQNGDILFLRLKTVHSFLRNYGKQVYKPFHEQTDKGLSKFYSILRYLVT